MTHPAHEMVAFVKSRAEYDRPDCQLGFMLLGTHLEGDKIEVDDFHALTVFQYYTRPTSRGFCQIQSSDPDAPMLINADYLDTDNDRRHSVDAIRFVKKLMS